MIFIFCCVVSKPILPLIVGYLVFPAMRCYYGQEDYPINIYVQIICPCAVIASLLSLLVLQYSASCIIL